MIIVGGGVYWNYLSTQENSPITQAPTQVVTPSVLSTTVNAESSLTIGEKNEKIDSGGYKHIYIDVVNNGSAKKAVSLMVTLYDESEKVIGTQLGAVQNIATGETKTADVIIFDKTMENYASYKVSIEGSY